MNDQQICMAIAKKPRMRASELANQFNVELTVVSSSLRSLVDVGDLVKSKEFDDNGRQSQVYELSAEFRRSREGKAILAAIDWKDQTPAELEAASVVAAAPIAAAEPVGSKEVNARPAADSHGPRTSKVQLALECIARAGFATDAQLRTVMGLPPKTYVGAYLVSAIKSGKVRRDGERWLPGSGTATQPRPPDSVEKVGKIVVATRAATSATTAVVVADIGAPEPAPAPAVELAPPIPAPPIVSFEAAIFSSGDLLITVGGDSVRLTLDHRKQLDSFLAPIVSKVVQVPSGPRVRRNCEVCNMRRDVGHFSGSSKRCKDCEAAK